MDTIYLSQSNSNDALYDKSIWEPRMRNLSGLRLRFLFRYAVFFQQKSRTVLIIVFALGIAGCYYLPVSRTTLQSPSDAFHGVKRIPSSTGGYSFLSYSRLNTDSGGVSTDLKPSYAETASGNLDNWTWRIYMDDRIKLAWGQWKNYRGIHNLHVKLGQDPSNHRLPAYPGVVSWRGAFERFKEVMTLIAGPRIAPLNIKLFLVSDQQKLIIKNRRFDADAVPLQFYFRFPETPGTGKKINHSRASALTVAFSDLGHEYYHALVHVDAVPAPTSLVTEEGIAYTVGTCIRIAMGGSIEGLGLHFSTRTLIPPPFIKVSELHKLYHYDRSATDDGNTLGMLNIASYIGTSVLEPGEYQKKNALLGFCQAMVQHPIDLTQGYYPRARVQPMPFFNVPPRTTSVDQRGRMDL